MFPVHVVLCVQYPRVYTLQGKVSVESDDVPFTAAQFNEQLRGKEPRAGFVSSAQEMAPCERSVSALVCRGPGKNAFVRRM